MKEEKIGILGFGQIGQAVSKFYSNFRVKDLKRDDGLDGIDILHVCIPYSESFVDTVKREISGIKPGLTIIHSTVAPGTTSRIKGKVVHSPVRGVHPYLYEGIKTFVKYIGADDLKTGKMAKRHLQSLGIKTKLVYPSVTTELGKLLDTTYYGLCIAWHSEMKKICKKFKVDFDQTVTDFNQTYNKGYSRLGLKNVIRPVLYAPKKNSIGGHCVIPNAEILKNHIDSQALDLILQFKPKNKKLPNGVTEFVTYIPCFNQDRITVY